MRAMHFLLSALGSAGDVHPFIAIGQALRARGHAVRIIAMAPFEARIAKAGLAFTPLGTDEDYQRLLARPDIWRPLDGARILIDELLERLPEAYETTTACVVPGDTVLVGSTMSLLRFVLCASLKRFSVARDGTALLSCSLCHPERSVTESKDLHVGTRVLWRFGSLHTPAPCRFGLSSVRSRRQGQAGTNAGVLRLRCTPLRMTEKERATGKRFKRQAGAACPALAHRWQRGTYCG